MITTNGLIAYWHFKKEINGNGWKNIAPQTIGNYNAMLMDNALPTESGIYLDGEGAYISIPYIKDMNASKNFSYEIRFKVDNAIDNPDIIFIPNIYYDPLYANGNDKITLETYGEKNGTKYENIQLNYDLSLINNIAVTYSEINGVKIYQNGELVFNSKNITNETFFFLPPYQTIGSLNISGEGYPMSGSIESIRMYNRELTHEEVIQNYSLQSDIGLDKIVTSGLITYWNGKYGIENNTWKNLSPSTQGKYDGIINGGNVFEGDGIYLSGNDNIEFQSPIEFLNNVTPFTLEMRMRLDNYSTVEILSRNSSYPYFIYINNNSLVVELSLSETQYSALYKIIELEDYEEYNLAFRYFPDIGRMDIFINGIFNSQLAYDAGYSTLPDSKNKPLLYTDKFKVGGGNGPLGSFPINGTIKNIKLYNRTLSDAEIKQNNDIGMEIGLDSNENPGNSNILINNNPPVNIKVWNGLEWKDAVGKVYANNSWEVFFRNTTFKTDFYTAENMKLQKEQTLVKEELNIGEDNLTVLSTANMYIGKTLTITDGINSENIKIIDIVGNSLIVTPLTNSYKCNALIARTNALIEEYLLFNSLNRFKIEVTEIPE